MRYNRDFFKLIDKYASKYSEITGEGIEDVLLTQTPFYYAIGNHTWESDKNSKLWLEYLDGIKDGQSPGDLAYDMYLKHLEKTKLKWFGCFRYKNTVDKEGIPIIKIHFENYDTSPYGPLSKERKEVRMMELKEMFTEIKSLYPDVKFVQGGSWLYHYDSYKRLFPKSYTEKMQEVPVKDTRMFVPWGPFVSSEGGLKEDLVEEFLKKIEVAKIVDQLKESFPLKGYFPRGRIEDFYEFYDISK